MLLGVGIRWLDCYGLIVIEVRPVLWYDVDVSSRERRSKGSEGSEDRETKTKTRL